MIRFRLDGCQFEVIEVFEVGFFQKIGDVVYKVSKWESFLFDVFKVYLNSV